MNERQEWVVIGLEQGLPDWTSEEMTISYQGFPLTLRPETEDRLATIAIPFTSPQTHQQAAKAGRRFLSAFAWLHEGQGRVEDDGAWGGGSFPVGLGKSSWHVKEVPSFRTKLRLDHLQEPSDPKTWLALAIYREARVVHSDLYELLGYFKIVNILADKGAQQKAWIKNTLSQIKDHDALGRIRKLQELEPDIPHYLYESGRCAVAHAHNDPVVDPDDPEDRHRVRQDLPLARALAEYAIEYALGVKSRLTIHREHLYQLAGFRDIFGAELVGRLKGDDAILLSDLPTIGPISIRFRDEEPFEGLDRMSVTPIGVKVGVVTLCLTSEDQLAAAVLGLDFRSEHLMFDFMQGLNVRDNGSVAAVEKQIDRIRVLECCVRNGQLEMWASATGTLLGRSDPIIPVNIDSGKTLDALRANAINLAAELDRRRGHAV
ncbi:MAG: methylamine utilization protein MauJ [Vicinamibacteria bacterium]